MSDKETTRTINKIEFDRIVTTWNEETWKAYNKQIGTLKGARKVLHFYKVETPKIDALVDDLTKKREFGNTMVRIHGIMRE